MNETYYNDKAPHYGMGHTRFRRIMQLVGNAQGKRVLDVACANGYLGAKIKAQGAYVAGVEISEKAAAEAAKVLDDVHVFDIQQPWPEHIGKFDIILLPEILEHVFDPVIVLNYARQVLSDDGVIIITTPNFLTWTNRLRFLFGAFRYQEQGMFDFGHIRWFTYAYLKEVLAKSHLTLVRENHIIFPGKLTRILKYFPSLFAWQFIIKVTKK